MSLIQQNMGAIYDGSQRLIAPVLNSTTATKNWAVGEEFILDGNLYEVTTAISSGSQIIVSGSSANCELADTVTEQIRVVDIHDTLTFSNKIQYPLNGQYLRMGNLIIINLAARLVTAFTANDVIISGLPKPKSDVYGIAMGVQNGFRIIANTTDLIVSTVSSSQPTNTWFSCLIMYLAE